MVKNLLANAGDTRDVGLMPGSGRSPGGANGNRLQYSCLGNSLGRGALEGYRTWCCKELDMTEHSPQHSICRCCKRREIGFYRLGPH